MVVTDPGATPSGDDALQAARDRKTLGKLAQRGLASGHDAEWTITQKGRDAYARYVAFITRWDVRLDDPWPGVTSSEL
jgi:hypothetical protein